MSQTRRCDISKAVDGKRYMILGNYEYTLHDRDCTTYGPFDSSDDVQTELNEHQNPGGFSVDPNGTMLVPLSAAKPNHARRGEMLTTIPPLIYTATSGTIHW